MLEHTLDRAEKIASAQRVFTIINKSHLGFPDVRRQLTNRSPNTVIMQPEPWDIFNYTDPTYFYQYDSAAFRALMTEAEASTMASWNPAEPYSKW